MAQLFGLARLGRDVEVRYTSGGEAVANLSLAFSWGKKGEDGNRPTQWVEASLWGKRAEALSQYLRKGGLVSVLLDDVHIEEYDKNDGGRGHKLAAKVLNVELAGGGREAGEGEAPTQRPRQQPAQRTHGQMRQQARQFEHDGMNSPNEAVRAKANTGFADMDDDIPFMDPYKGRRAYLV